MMMWWMGREWVMRSSRREKTLTQAVAGVDDTRIEVADR